MAILIFTFMIGGMVGVISRNGGMVGIVDRIMPFASNPRRGQGVIASLGLAIFFDDYANREEILNKMDKYREESPLDDVPYNDEVAEDREAKKLEKDLEDKIRIEKLVDEETSDKDKT